VDDRNAVQYTQLDSGCKAYNNKVASPQAEIADKCFTSTTLTVAKASQFGTNVRVICLSRYHRQGINFRACRIVWKYYSRIRDAVSEKSSSAYFELRCTPTYARRSCIRGIIRRHARLKSNYSAKSLVYDVGP
jgi:hypothetical protein